MEHKHQGLALLVIIAIVLWYIFDKVKQTTYPTDAYSAGYIPPNDSRRISGAVDIGTSCNSGTAGKPSVMQSVGSFFGINPQLGR